MKTSNQLVNRLHFVAALIFAAALLAAPISRADTVYVSNAGDNTIRKFDLATGADLGVFANTSPNVPSGLAFDSAGNLYVALNNSTIEKFTPGGVGSLFASAGLNAPTCLAFDSAGNLYAGNNGDGAIEKFTPSGVGSLFANAGLMSDPDGLAFDGAGNLYSGSFGSNTIAKFSPAGTGLGDFASGLNAPTGLAFDGAGNLYVANLIGNTIEKFTPGGVGSVFANTGLSGPYGLAFDSAGNLYVANSGGNTIEKFTPGGVGSVFANTGLNGPEGIAIRPEIPGTYAGLFYDTNGITHQSSGYFTFALAKTWKFNGKILIEGGSYPLTGNFDTNTYSTNVVVARIGKPSLAVSLQLGQLNKSAVVSGTVSDGSWTAQLSGDRAYYSVTNLPPQLGQYTMTILGDSNGDDSPGYGSYGIVTVKSNGFVKLIGKLSDNTPTSETTTLSKAGVWPLYVPLYQGAGSLLGWMTFTNQPTYKLTGDVRWIKTNAFGLYYTSGFTNDATVFGAIRH